MIDTYIKVEDWRKNEGHSGEITEKDELEILNILNLQQYTERYIASQQLCDSDLNKIREELADEADEKFRLGEISEGYWILYPDNCHSLTRKMEKRRGWTRVFGYVFLPADLGKNKLRLYAHSVTKDEFKRLIELTDLFSPQSHYFIEHESGQCGIDLIAYKNVGIKGVEI